MNFVTGNDNLLLWTKTFVVHARNLPLNWYFMFNDAMNFDRLILLFIPRFASLSVMNEPFKTQWNCLDFANWVDIPRQQVAKHFYHKDMQIELVKSDFLGETNHYTFQLTFDNRAFSLASLAMTREEKHLPISASVLFEIFPFCVVFG